MTVIIDGETLSINDVVSVARYFEKVDLSLDSGKKVTKCRDFVESLVADEKVVYGVTTGFGAFDNVFISKEQSDKLQENLILSHAAAVGPPLPEEVVRATMLLRANSLSKGYSGVRIEIIETLVHMLNQKVHPVIPEKGSLGASGDLANLAHMVLVMLGKGEAFYHGERMSGSQAMVRAGIITIRLSSKEGLALINGTQVMTAIAALLVHDSQILIKSSEITASMSLEALKGTARAYDEKVGRVRPHNGQVTCADNLRRLTVDSEIMESHRYDKKVQDAYSLRCIPQIVGASRDALSFVREKVEIEINSATDNPLLFPDEDEIISSGNFHGQVIAISLDFLGIALSEVASVCERRIERLVNPQLSGLPAFLTEKEGLNSGFMVAQYTAVALVSENKVLSHPASVDSIPTSANKEDHVSMGMTAALKARRIFDNASFVVAIELLCAAQGLDFRKPLKAGAGAGAAYELVRSSIEHLADDRILHYDINEAHDMVVSGEVLKAVEKIVGELA
ncbi:MAG TPA: histidine ammonia-lyase [Candidatus Nanoarchaeia archaeon]|nr:histidine ammonia-lyase [Candidatus Nanoarchaeia archaeon]